MKAGQVSFWLETFGGSSSGIELADLESAGFDIAGQVSFQFDTPRESSPGIDVTDLEHPGCISACSSTKHPQKQVLRSCQK